MRILFRGLVLSLLLATQAFGAATGSIPKKTWAPKPSFMGMTFQEAQFKESLRDRPVLDAGLARDSLHIGIANEEMTVYELRPEVKVTKADFFKTYGASFGLKPEIDAMVEESVFKDGDGITFSRWKQTHKGLPVLGTGFVLAERKAVASGGSSKVPGPSIGMASGRAAAFLEIDTTPSISAEQALEIALNDIGAETYSWEAQPALGLPPSGLLALSSKDYENKDRRLVYQFTISSEKPLGAWDIQIDAKTGEVVNRFNVLARQNWEPPIWSDINNTEIQVVTHYQLGTDTKIWADPKPDGGYWLQSKIDPAFHLGANIVVVDTEDSRLPSASQTNVFANGIKWGFERGLDFFETMLGYQGLDGHGGTDIVALVSRAPMGSGSPYGKYRPGGKFYFVVPDDKSAGDFNLKDIGHEMFHGVIEQNSKLILVKESGAIHEAFADLFGVFIDAFGDRDVLTWMNFLETGPSDAWKIQGHFLNAPTTNKNPAAFGDQYYEEPVGSLCNESNDYCGIHHNSTVISHAFYLIAKGGKDKNSLGKWYNVQGIGSRVMAELAFDTMRSLPQKASFEDVYNTSLWAAKKAAEDPPDIIEARVNAVMNAFYAVGIGPRPWPDRGVQPARDEKDVEPWPASLKVEVEAEAIACEIELKAVDERTGVLTKVETKLSSPKDATTTTDTGETIQARYCELPDINLEGGKPYFWKVRTKTKETRGVKDVLRDAKSFFGRSDQSKPTMPAWGTWSEYFHFVTDRKWSIFVSPYPVSHGLQEVYPWPAELVWEGVKGAESYEVILKDFVTDETLLRKSVDPRMAEHQKGGNIKADLTLKIGQKYDATVSAIGPEGKEGEPSLPVFFVTKKPITELLTPDDGASVNPWMAPLTWKKVPGRQKYDVFLSKTSTFTYKDRLEGTNAAEGVQLGVPTDSPTMYWAVSAIGPPPRNEAGPLSAPRSFVPNKLLTKPTPYNPKSPGIVPYLKSPVVFSWSCPIAGVLEEAPGVYKFKLDLRKKDTEGNCSEKSPVLFNDFVQAGKTGPDTDCLYLYYFNASGASGTESEKTDRCWRVTAYGPNDEPGVTSEFASYPIGDWKPVLKSPADKSANLDSKAIDFSWECSNCPNGYKLSVGIVGQQLQVVETTATHASIENLMPGDDFYVWYVEAKPPSGSTAPNSSSGIWTFTTKEEPKETEENRDCSSVPGTPQWKQIGNLDATTFKNQMWIDVADTGTFTWTNTGASYYLLSRTGSTDGSLLNMETMTPQKVGNGATNATISHVNGGIYGLNIQACNACDQCSKLKYETGLIYYAK